MKSSALRARLMMVASMLIFGTIGIFRKYIVLPSGLLAGARGVIGCLFIFLVMTFGKKRPDLAAARRHLKILLFSGAALGFNWILLFEAYRYTTVAVATLCYYMAPMIVIVVSALCFGERLTRKKGLSVAAAFLGVIFASGIVTSGFSGGNDAIGILFGLGAAVLYAAVMLLNKKLTQISAMDRTVFQLGIAGVILLIYSGLTESWVEISFSGLAVCMLFVVGILHTGIAYALYFASFRELPVQSVALLAYIDPASAIVLSVLILGETMDLWQILGAVLILVSAAVSETDFGKRNNK